MKKHSGELTPLIRINRKELLKVFQAHNPNKEDKLPLHEFYNICGNLHFCPTLISKKDLGKLLKSKGFIHPLSFKKFQILLKLLAKRSFPSALSLSERLVLLFTHSKTHFENTYSAHLTTDLTHGVSPRRSKPHLKPSELEGRTDRTRQPSNIKKGKSFSLASSSLIHTDRTNPGLSRKHTNLRTPVNSLKKGVGNAKLSQSENRPTLSIERKVPSLQPFLAEVLNQSRQEEISKTFRKFKETHTAIATAAAPNGGPWEQIRRQQEYIHNLRLSLFDGHFVVALIFRSWRGYTRRNYP